MTLHAITVLGHDRPGIIAEATDRLAGLGLNLEDSTMTLLRGHFAMMLVCEGTAPDAEIEEALAPLTADGRLLATVREVGSEVEAAAAGEPYIMSVHGADRLGIVAAVTRVLAEAGGNITDLTTRLSGSLYVVVAEVDVSDPERLDTALQSAAQRLGVEVSLRPADADLL